MSAIKATINLTEDQLREAVLAYIRDNFGCDANGVSFSHDEGNQREPSTTTASAFVTFARKPREKATGRD